LYNKLLKSRIPYDTVRQPINKAIAIVMDADIKEELAVTHSVNREIAPVNKQSEDLVNGRKFLLHMFLCLSKNYVKTWTLCLE
jgi:hypothetical protein